MANENLKGLKVAILITDGFEQVEMTEPRKALDQAGAETRIVSPKGDRVRAWNFTDWGDEFPVDVALDQAQPQDFDALLLPGGTMNPDMLRVQAKAIEFAKAFFNAGKPVASICHGAQWMDQEVVVDSNLVTSRKPDDIPAFNREMIELFSRVRGQAQPVA
jgi:protease I